MLEGVVAMVRKRKVAKRRVSRAKRVKRSAAASRKGMRSSRKGKVKKTAMRRAQPKVRKTVKRVHTQRRARKTTRRVHTHLQRKRAGKIHAGKKPQVGEKRKPARLKSLIVRPKTAVAKRPVTPVPAPTIEQRAAQEMPIGTVTHYYSNLSVGIIALTATLRVGDRIRIKGRTTDLTQAVESMQIEHQPVAEANAGQVIGVKVVGHVRDGDMVHKLA